MASGIRNWTQGRTHGVLLAGLMSLSLMLPIHASATLGGDVTSVEVDQQQMKAKRAVQASGKYSVHEISTSYGGVVREYVSPDGRVFGVAWRGPFMPDLQQILGDYYARFTQQAQIARATQKANSRRAPMIVDQPDLVMFSGGHTRAYIGHAYVPGMLPKGVDANEIH